MGKKKSFEEKMDELEGIIAALSGGGAGLSESAKLYESGVKLLNELQGELSAVQEKVRLLSIGSDGEPKLVDFDGGERNES